MRRRTGFGGAEGAEWLGSLEGVGDVGFVVGSVECDAVPAALVLLVADAEAGKSIKGREKRTHVGNRILLLIPKHFLCGNPQLSTAGS